MSDKCTDENVGRLLHAFELGMLSQEESESFINHCLVCEYCSRQLADFQPAAEILTNDPQVPAVLEGRRHGKDRTGVPNRTLLDFLWPDFPLILRPGILILALLLLSYPAYMGVAGRGQRGVSPLQSVELAPQRASQAVKLETEPKTDVVLSFLYPGARKDGEYQLSLSYEGSKLYQDSHFAGFDSFGVAHILLPSKLVRPGQYHLVVEDNQGSAQTQKLEYKFTLMYTTGK